MAEHHRAEPEAAPRMAAWSVRRPWRALGLWIALVVACVAVGVAVGTRQIDSADAGVGPSGDADRAVAAAPFGPAGDDEFALIRRDDGAVLTAAQVQSAERAVRRELDGTPWVSGITPPQRSADGRAALMRWRVEGTSGETPTRVAGAIAAVGRADAQVDGVRIDEVGEASLAKAMNDTIGEDFKKAEVLSLPITFLILLVVFGAVVAALLPLLLAITAIAAAFGLAAISSHAIPQTEALATMLLLVGVAVGVDYALFMVRRAREERSLGRSVADSVLVAAATSGRAVTIAGVTVMVAMAGMLLLGEPTFASMGIASMLVVGCAVAGSVTALPAVLRLLGDRVDWIPVPFLRRARARSHGESRLWGAIAGATVRRPLMAFLASAGVLAALALPLMGMNMQLPSYDDMPRTLPAVQTLDAMQKAFPQEGAQHDVVVVPRGGRTMDRPEVKEAVAALQRQLEARDWYVADATRPLAIADDRSVGIISVSARGPEDGAVARRALQDLRGTLLPAAFTGVADVYVTGFTASSVDFTTIVSNRLPIVMAFVIALTFVVMLWSFRSAWLAGATVALNALSVAAAYGLLVIVFQHHWFDGLLGAATNGSIITWLPPFMFVILFGLSMDYHVFVLSRVREASREGLDPAEAIRAGVARSGSVVTSAAAVMIAAFGIFATLSTIDMKQLGVGLAAAILIDATIVRGVLLPATLRLLGTRAWGRTTDAVPGAVQTSAR